ncbi:MAG: hypothetical protein A2W28_12280 [Gammaproteobacteria bacterium RBG_16_51_14]|nr:MAG: hypothetical protein A2W28_12280 [Gammaproteobacteria bacterium RBG_16_51_14]
MRRILVTGGCGFIGSHLVDLLLTLGHQVVVVDDLSTGKVNNLPLGRSELQFVRSCVTDRVAMVQALDRVDAVVHLAAVSSVQASVDDPVRTHGVNFTGTLNVLEACREVGVRKLVFASSAAVYGNPASLPVGETLVPEPLTPYAIDKFASEQCLSFYRRTFDFDTTIFRLFNVYGPRQDPSSPYSGVISLFVAGAMAGQPIIIFGDGSQTRDFIYVTDVVTAIAGALECPSFAGGPVNVGTGSSQSLHDVIAALKALTERDIYVHYDRARHGDIKHSCADTTRLRATGWKPATSLIVGLSRIIEEAYSL